MPILEQSGLLETVDLVAGKPSDTSLCKRRTVLIGKTVQENIGGIPFGSALTMDTANTEDGPNPRIAVKLPAAGETFVGFATYSEGTEDWLNGDPEDYDHPRGYKGSKAIPAHYSGPINLNTVTAVAPGDPVFIHVSTDLKNGWVRNDAGTGGIAVPSAVFRGTADADGVVAVYVDLVA